MMPIPFVIMVAAVAFILGWVNGKISGYEEANEYTEKWFQRSQYYLEIIMSLPRDKGPRGGLQKTIKKEPASEPVKVIAKAAGASRSVSTRL